MSAREPDITREAKAAKALREALLAYGDEDLVLDAVEGETGLFEAVDFVLSRIFETQALIDGLDGIISSLVARRERFDDRLGACRAAVEQALILAEIFQNIERPGATIFLSARPPKVEVHTEAEIPAEFWKAGEPKLDKSALGKALKEGRDIPGACLSNAAPTLTVRVL